MENSILVEQSLYALMPENEHTDKERITYLCAVFSKSKSRLEELEKQNSWFREKLDTALGLGDQMKDAIIKLEKQVVDLKCCGNCEHVYSAKCFYSKYLSNNYCTSHEPDGLSRKERER